jgi:adenylate cyclase, class 1
MTFNDIITKNKESFLKFNEAKYNRFQELFLNSNASRIINSIPLLLNVNHSSIPGYCEGDTPYGIVNYTPDQSINNYIETRFRTRNLKIGTEKPFIEMLAVMGSIGTIAYTKKSDFDFWVCIDRRRVNKEQLKKFVNKVKGIQKWIITESKLDVNLFINDVEDIKNNLFDESEEEAFGTTIGALLKDEFYRSSIVLSGKIPFWWVMPKFVTDNEYSKAYNNIPEEMKENDFIDLGNLYSISKEDFLGAALFQLIKSLGNPFKSIIKLGVLEKYLYKSGSAPLLSQKVKSSVLRGQIDNKILDSYILMFDEVYDYYESALKEKDLLKILRQNLYLKINPQLSKYTGMKNSKNLPYNVSVMFNYTRDWKWTQDEINDLDNFSKWDYNRIMAFWNLVKKFMLLSYQNISTALPKFNLQQKLSDTDFQLLNRKIKTHFLPKANKIDQYITFKETPHESVLYIEPESVGIKEVEWKLYKNVKDSNDRLVSTVLNTQKDLLKLISWTAINKIFDPVFSRIKIVSGYSRINQNLIIELLSKISELFVSKSIHIKNEYYTRPVFNVVNMVILNFNLENQSSLKTIHHLYHTSWGEAYIDYYENEDCLAEILTGILKNGLILKRDYSDYCHIFSPEPTRKIYRDIEKIFRDSYKSIIQESKRGASCLVLNLSGKYLIINNDNGNDVKIDILNNPLKMMATITLNPRKQIIYNFQGKDNFIKAMSESYKNRQNNGISIIYQESNKHLFSYVINERGNMFTFVTSASLKNERLENLYSFSLNVINTINSFHYFPDIIKRITVYRLNLDKEGNYSVTEETGMIKALQAKKTSRENSADALISRYMTRDNYYSLKFSDNTSTEFIPLEKLPEIVNNLRINKNRDLQMINNIEISDVKSEDISTGTSIYFIEKYRIELMIGKSRKEQVTGS